MKTILLSISLLLSPIPLLAMESDAGVDLISSGIGTLGVDDNEGKQEEGCSDDEKEIKDDTKEIMKFPQVHFSPHIQDVLINLIDHEKKRLRGAWYRLTLNRVAHAIVGRIEKEVKVSIIVDEGHFDGVDYWKNERRGEFCTPLKSIIDAGGKVYKKLERNFTNRTAKMLGYGENVHHKFMIFNRNVGNKKLVWTGSFNATGQSHRNCENAVILDDSDVIECFEREFTYLREYGQIVPAAECVSKRDQHVADMAREMNDIPKLSTPVASRRFLKPNKSSK